MISTFTLQRAPPGFRPEPAATSGDVHAGVMSYVADVLAGRLIALNVATAGAVFVDALPEPSQTVPEAVVALWDTMGSDLPSLGCAAPATSGRMQLLVRGAVGDVATTRKRAWRAYQALGAINGLSASVNDEVGAMATIGVLAINFDGPPNLIERDHNERPLFSANATVWFTIGAVT